MARIMLDQVTKAFPTAVTVGAGREPRPVVDALDLTIEEGEFLVLVGPSGCGKTTSLRMIAGLELATSGRISFDDRDVTRVPARDRNVAFVFQDFALYPHLTVAANIGFPLRMAGVPADLAEAHVQRVAGMLRIGDQLTKRPRQLSSGQRQRVAMGRAVVRDPDVFLMDEPLSNLDAVLRAEVRAEISALQQRLGRTTVYVTHDGEEALSMGHRVAVMRHGVLQQCGTPEELYSTPSNAFVAGFVGTPQMNFVPGQLWRDECWQVAFGPVRLTLPDSTVARHPRLHRQEGNVVVVGFRPETVVVDPEASDVEALDVRVTAVHHLGNHVRVYFPEPEHGAGVGQIDDLAGLTHKVGRPGELMATISPPRPMTVGDRLRLRVQPDALHLFDACGRAL